MGLLDRIKRALGDDDDSVEVATSTQADPAIVAELRAFVAEKSDGQLQPDDIDANEHLYDAGYVDSQSSVALLAFIEERWGVEISEVDLVGHLSSLNDLARRLVANL